MKQKKLEKGSVWEKADANGDGVVTDQEMAMRERMVLLENRDKKEGSTALSCVVFSINCYGFYSCIDDTFDSC